jgi:hypothetical protein
VVLMELAAGLRLVLLDKVTLGLRVVEAWVLLLLTVADASGEAGNAGLDVAHEKRLLDAVVVRVGVTDRLVLGVADKLGTGDDGISRHSLKKVPPPREYEGGDKPGATLASM